MEKLENHTNSFEKWITSPNSTTVAAQEIIKRGKTFPNGEYMKDSFIKISVCLFSDFKNKTEEIQKTKDKPLFTKTVKERAIKMEDKITNQQIKDISFKLIAFNESCDMTDIEQTALL